MTVAIEEDLPRRKEAISRCFKETKISGDLAYEWGFFSGTMKRRSGGDSITAGGKVMRVLQRQPNGAWKVARTMYVNDSK